LNIISTKFKEVLYSVLPITIIVLLLNFTLTPMSSAMVWKFVIGSVLIIIALTIFLLGVEIGVTPFGNITGKSLAQRNKLWIVLIAGLILGFFISIAEPGLLVLANQVNLVTAGEISGYVILIVVSVGMAIMIAFGFWRVFYNVPLFKVLALIYVGIFGLAIFTSREFLSIAFDASGATTGILAVPFILALSVGISKLKKDSKAAEEDSFGLVALASSGAIISVMILDLLTNTNEFTAALEITISDQDAIFTPFIAAVPMYLVESIISILPLFVIFLFLQKVSFKLKKKDFRQILTGFGFTFIGLLIFLIAVNTGFMDVGTSVGTQLASMENKLYFIIISFILGVVIILAEPAVNGLTHQIEDITSGYVKRKAVLTSLSIGVGLAVCLSAIRILVPSLQLWHYLLPGYILAVAMMFFAPKLFVGIAFDAGGVATGPMTATFVLAFIQGAADVYHEADLMADGFGMIAMVAMFPIITLQILGIIFAIKSKTKGVERHSE